MHQKVSLNYTWLAYLKARDETMLHFFWSRNVILTRHFGENSQVWDETGPLGRAQAVESGCKAIQGDSGQVFIQFVFFVSKFFITI